MARAPRLVDGKLVPFPQAEEAARDAEEAAFASALAAAAALAYRGHRAAQYRDQLGKETGDYVKTLGDVLDVLIAQVESMRQAANAAAIPDYTALLARIAAIKAANPKPA